MKGVEAIRDAWKRLPSRPGVYRMIGADGEVLYVGKAKSLKNRVAHVRARARAHQRDLPDDQSDDVAGGDRHRRPKPKRCCLKPI